MDTLASRGMVQRVPDQAPENAGYDILILDAEHKQSLAAARSLGRAGLRVAMGESLALYRESPPLPAFCSRYCARAVVLPSHADDIDAYVAAIFDFVREHPTSVILPAGDAAAEGRRSCPGPTFRRIGSPVPVPRCRWRNCANCRTRSRRFWRCCSRTPKARRILEKNLR